MSSNNTRPDLEVESKRDFFAQMNLGFRAEYEFGTGRDCFEFITRELGVNIIKNEDVISKKETNVRHTRSKTQEKIVNNLDTKKELDANDLVSNTLVPTEDDIVKIQPEQFIPNHRTKMRLMSPEMQKKSHTETGEFIVKENKLSFEHESPVEETDKITENIEFIVHEDLVPEMEMKEKQNESIDIELNSTVDETGQGDMTINESNIGDKVLNTIETKELSLSASRDKDLDLDTKEIGLQESTNETHHNVEINNLAITKDINEARIENLVENGDINNKEPTLVFDKEHLKDKPDDNENIVYQCYICNENFPDKAKRKEHIASHLQNEPLSICPFCGKTFTDKDKLFQHFTTHLTKTSQVISKNSEESSKETPINQCKICLNTFGRKANLIRHINLIHSKKGEHTFKCKLCPRTFRRSYDIKRHMQSHNAQREYKCNVCQKSFFRKYHLSRHLNLHSGTKFTCQYCSKQYSTNHRLMVHCVQYHNKDKFTCHICSKDFCGPSILRRHVNDRHQRQKDFSCKTCPRTFTTEYYCKAHESTHQRVENICPFCGKQCIRKSELERHRKSHTGQRDFKCQQCPQKFYTRYHLMRHMTVHTGLKRFECPVCLGAFTTRYHMRFHLRKHIAPKVYNCKYCINKYYSLNSFRKHIKEHAEKS